ncbi:MAG: hypothetical protein KF686_19745 [Ramlibacter sp.]|nr:hypothetical protein [Ramlibacter sp.]
MPKLRVVVGQGTASEVFQGTVGADGYHTIAIGPTGLWAVLPNTHRMGQPSHLLTLPGQQVPAFQAPTGTSTVGLSRFMDVHSYQSGLEALALKTSQASGRLQFPGAKVTDIERDEGTGNVRVRVTGLPEPTATGFVAEQVIVASGIGPQKTPADAGITVTGVPDDTLGFKQMEEGIDYLTHPDQLGRVTIAYGGGATGAWVAHELAERWDQVDWCWMARMGGEGFARSTLPGDRNARILSFTGKQIRRNIVAAEYVAAGSVTPATLDAAAVPPRSMIKLTIERQGQLRADVYVDKLIYSIGGHPGARGSVASMLDDALVSELEPVRDQNRMVSDGSGTLAWATPKRDLIIVGASTYNFTEPFFNKAKQPAPMSTLPTNAQVPDGIAVIVSTIEALNQYMPVEERMDGGLDWTINFNTSNQTQIAAFLASTTDLEPYAANLAVALIIHFRSNTTFGIEDRHVQFICRTCERAVAMLRSTVPNFDTTRLANDKRLGVEAAQAAMIARMVSEHWTPVWRRGGLRA